MKPESDRDLKSLSGGSFGLGLDWSCGPQLASVNGVIVWFGRGNFINASIFGFFVLWNAIPSVFVPFRYLMIRLAASVCLRVALWLYFESRLVAVAISGRVDVANHWRLPVYDCRMLLPFEQLFDWSKEIVV